MITDIASPLALAAAAPERRRGALQLPLENVDHTGQLPIVFLELGAVRFHGALEGAEPERDAAALLLRGALLRGALLRGALLRALLRGRHYALRER
jgi:hypothetical protein